MPNYREAQFGSAYPAQRPGRVGGPVDQGGGGDAEGDSGGGTEKTSADHEAAAAGPKRSRVGLGRAAGVGGRARRKKGGRALCTIAKRDAG